MKTLCTDSHQAWNELEKPLRLVCKDFSKRAKSKRLTKQAIAQILDEGRFTESYRHAVLLSFREDPSILTKKEKKILKLCHQISQTEYMSHLHKMVLVNDKAYANLKVVAEIKGLIKSNDNTIQERAAKLNINLSSEKTKEPPAKDDTAPTVDTDTPPLMLTN